jgi:quercetin dioxygenase-like cupin family protein
MLFRGILFNLICEKVPIEEKVFQDINSNGKEQKMFCKKDPAGYRTMVEGVQLKTLVWGERTLLCEFKIEKGASLPSHTHPHEQTGYLVSGRMNFTIGGETYEVEPGDGWSIRGDVEHAAEALEESRGVEVFSPLREEYLP